MQRMPVVFVGHGSPMNAIETNIFSSGWQQIGKSLPVPKAILVVSAHWYTKGTRVMTQADPKQIYDFYGFPRELYEAVYPVKGSPDDANKALNLLKGIAVPDETWGIDHGSWSFLKHFFPKADVPVFQVSIDRTQPPEFHYSLGEKLRYLRNQGILIIGSGNVVHSFRGSSFDMAGGHPWAYEFDDYIHQCIIDGNHDGVVSFSHAGPSAHRAFETPDHYYPLLYSLGASESRDQIETFNRACVFGGFSMTGYLFSDKG